MSTPAPRGGQNSSPSQNRAPRACSSGARGVATFHQHSAVLRHRSAGGANAGGGASEEGSVGRFPSGAGSLRRVVLHGGSADYPVGLSLLTVPEKYGIIIVRTIVYCILVGRDWCGDKVLCTGCVQEFTGGLSSSGTGARVAPGA